MSTLFLGIIFLNGYTPFERTGENCFHIQVNGLDVGTLGDKSHVEELLLQARKTVASESSELVFMEVDMAVVGEEVLWGRVDEEEEVLSRMVEALRAGVQESMQRSYTLKINEYIISLASVEDVRRVLQAAIDKYGGGDRFAVELKYDTDREFGVLTADVVSTAAAVEEVRSDMEAGIQSLFAGLTGAQAMQKEGDERELEEFDLGIHSMNFAEEIEIVETYLPENQLTGLEDAINLVIMEQETASVYEVVAGDTLSEIAIKLNIPMDRIVEMNDMENVDDLHVGDQLFITVPEPELSVRRTEEKFYEEIYDAEPLYIDNDSWYTNQVVLRQPPSAGLRRVVADVTYLNEKEISREILKEEVVMEAKAKVIERGTIVPPTYVRPVSGGRTTSSFGPRKAPLAGASTNHKGVDWAVPTGTSVYASSGGTVVRAGWGSGYGYVVYIDHEDGRQTRYAHLSKILVKVGQKVKQNDKIALSGMTGNVTGPHLHFEILINGSQVNPEKYLDK